MDNAENAFQAEAMENAACAELVREIEEFSRYYWTRVRLYSDKIIPKLVHAWCETGNL